MPQDPWAELPDAPRGASDPWAALPPAAEPAQASILSRLWDALPSIGGDKASDRSLSDLVTDSAPTPPPMRQSSPTLNMAANIGGPLAAAAAYKLLPDWLRKAGDSAIPTALRVVPAVVGGAVGGTLGSVLPGPGTVLGAAGGGALLGGLGETAAQALEIQSGQREKINPTQIGVQTVLSGVPLPGATAARTGVNIAKRSAQGAVLGGVGTGATEMAETGQLPTVRTVATGATLGAVLGGGVGGVESRLARRVPAAGVPPADVPSPVVPAVSGHVLPELDAMASARAAEHAKEAQKPSLLKRAQRAVVNRYEPVEALMKAGGLDPMAIPAEKNPMKTVDLVHGGTNGKIQQTAETFREIQQQAEKAGVLTQLDDYLTLRGVQTGQEVLENKALRAGAQEIDNSLLAPQQAAADALLRSTGVEDIGQAQALALKWSKRAFAKLTPEQQRAVVELKALADATADAAPTSTAVQSIAIRTVFAQSDIAAGRGTANISAARAKEGLALLQQDPNFATVQELGDRVFDLNRQALDTAVEAGLINQKVGEELRKRSGGYVPLDRVMQKLDANFASSGLSLPSQHVLFTLEGSEKAIRNPIESSMRRAATVIREAEKNRAIRSVVAIRDKNDTLRGLIREVARDAKVGTNEGTIALFSDGKVQHYAVPKDLEEALKGLNNEDASFIGKALLGWFGSTLRLGATTANLGFSIPNVVRDVAELRRLESGVPSGATFTAKWAGETAQAVIDWVRALKEISVSKVTGRNTAAYRDYNQSGAAFSTFQRNISRPERFLAETTGAQRFNPIKLVEGFNDTLENATKMAAYQRQLRAGTAPDEAAWQARRFGGSPDFARGGGLSSQANLFRPFFNAQVQGVARIGPRLREHPERLPFVLADVTAKLLKLNAINQGFVDPDGTKSWDRISRTEKENNFILIVPTRSVSDEGVVRHDYLKIPKSHLTKIFSNPIQSLITGDSVAQTAVNAALDAVPGGMRVDLDHPVESVLDSAVAGMNPVAKVPVETYFNRDTYRGVPIVSARLEGVAPSEQIGPRTSPTVAAVASRMGVSPLKAQHATRGIFAGLADTGIGIADIGRSVAVGEPLPKDTPIVGAIGRRFVGGSGSMDQVVADQRDQFYTALKGAQSVRATAMKMAKEGRVAEARAYLQQNVKAFQSLKSLESLQSALARARQAQNPKAERELLKLAMKVLGDAR